MREKQAASATPDAPARGFVLVGGRSSRFGADKALHPLDGRPMALRVADVVAQVAASVTLVGPPEKYAALGLPVIPDKVIRGKPGGIGPLGGILAALEASETDWNLIAACDLPGIERGVPARLLRRARALPAVDAVWPATPDGRLQPLCAAYAKRAAGPARQAAERGVHKLADAFAACRIAKLPFDDPAPFRNANRAGDMEALLQAGANGA